MSTSTINPAEPGFATAAPMSTYRVLCLAQRLSVRGWRLWAAYWDFHLRRATVRMLHALDERTLRDIRLARSEINAAIFGVSADRLSANDPHLRGTVPEWPAAKSSHLGTSLPCRLAAWYSENSVTLTVPRPFAYRGKMTRSQLSCVDAKEE